MSPVPARANQPQFFVVNTHLKRKQGQLPMSERPSLSVRLPQLPTLSGHVQDISAYLNAVGQQLNAGRYDAVYEALNRLYVNTEAMAYLSDASKNGNRSRQLHKLEAMLTHPSSTCSIQFRAGQILQEAQA